MIVKDENTGVLTSCFNRAFVLSFGFNPVGSFLAVCRYFARDWDRNYINFVFPVVVMFLSAF